MTEAVPPMPSYKKPPIIEAVWSVQFAELTWLLAPHTGLFWDLVRDRFPACEEQPPIPHVLESESIFSPPAGYSKVLPAPPLNRHWFVSSSENELIQLQRDRFCCNWRKVNPTDTYPRYQRMRELFESNWRVFCRFVADLGHPDLSIDQCEMTYINHIDQGHGWNSIEQAGQVFRPVRWAHRMEFLPAPKTIGVKLVFDIPNLGGRLHVSLRHGVKTDESSENNQLLVLELTARGLPARTDLQGVLDWYALARESIVRGFADLTSPEMHTVWERER